MPPDARRAHDGMWRCFWANAGSRPAQVLSSSLRVRLLSKTVGPVYDYRNSRWPPQQTIGKEVDALQRKMAASILRVARRPGEDAVEFCRRRNNAAGSLCRAMGLWSSRWFKRTLAWKGSNAWSPLLIFYRAKRWLHVRRASFVRHSSHEGSCHAGRTGTRQIMGAPCVRWHDGIDFANTL